MGFFPSRDVVYDTKFIYSAIATQFIGILEYKLDWSSLCCYAFFFKKNSTVPAQSI